MKSRGNDIQFNFGPCANIYQSNGRLNYHVSFHMVKNLGYRIAKYSLFYGQDYAFN